MIKVNNLCFSYSKKPFITNMSFTVKKGEIFGFLGPSGAGKSTLMKILIGMLQDYKGSVTVGGIECSKPTQQFYENMGVDFEFSTLYEKLTARENLQFFASLYSSSIAPVDEMLEWVGLDNDADKRVSEYSKGMKARLNFIKAILHDPQVIFLDEPTSGLDPTNNRIMKDLIKQQKQKGKTILITTHNMQDATELCDRVAFIVNGKLYALDTPHNLIMSRGASKVTYSWMEHQNEMTASCDLSNISQDENLKKLIKENRICSIHSSEPTLNDIFIEITGRTLV